MAPEWQKREQMAPAPRDSQMLPVESTAKQLPYDFTPHGLAVRFCGTAMRYTLQDNFTDYPMNRTSTIVDTVAGGQPEGPRACIHPYKAELNLTSGRWELFGPSGVNIYEPGFDTVGDAETYAKRCIRYDNE